ncbi:MAG: L-threonylcarbamoyladenylate synthase [Nitrospiraceae bacterium]
MATVLSLQLDSSSRVFDEATRVLRRSGVIAVPTETFYALGASTSDEVAIRRVCAIKGRPHGKPILALIADRTQLTALVNEVTSAATTLMERFWPGPLTLIFPASPLLPEVLTAGTGSVGVRQTAHAGLAPLLRHVGPLTGTSANRSGEPPARTAEEVQTTLGSEVDLILDGGSAAGGLPSTIVDTVGPIRLLREGPISRQQIETALSMAGMALGSS